MFNHEAQEALNQKHLHNPQIGDYWHEMFCPYFVVIGVRPEAVTVCDKQKNVGANRWTWDVTQVTTLTPEEFRRQLCYSSGNLKNTTVANVVPDAKNHSWVREAAMEALFGNTTLSKDQQ